MGKEYSMDMSGESKKSLFPEGERELEIIGCVDTISKKNNNMFQFTVRDVETGAEDDRIYAISQKGRRWFLKEILAACKVAASKDGVYDWDISDVIGKIVTATVKHYDNKYINRDNQEVSATKQRITDFKASPPF